MCNGNNYILRGAIVADKIIKSLPITSLQAASDVPSISPHDLNM